MADRAFARLVKEPHELLSNLLLVLAGVHAAAALAHHWLLRDRTLKRMLPGRGRLKTQALSAFTCAAAPSRTRPRSLPIVMKRKPRWAMASARSASRQ